MGQDGQESGDFMTYCPFEDDCPFPDGRCTGDPFLGEDDCPYLMDISKEEWEEEMKHENNVAGESRK